MRFMITLRGAAPLSLPLSYHYIVQGFIYATLAADPTYSSYLHDTGFQAKNRMFRLFTFGPLTGAHRITNGQIMFPQDLFLEIRSPEAEFISHLAAVLMPGRVVELDRQPVTIVETHVKSEPVLQEAIKIRMLSPIVAYRTTQDRKTIYYNPIQQEFPELVNRNFQSKYTAYTGKLPGNSIILTPVSIGVQDKEVTRYKGFYITGWCGEYLLSGKAEYLDFLYNAGLGAKNSQGFGMFDIVSTP